jgi:hypothetical protein
VLFLGDENRKVNRPPENPDLLSEILGLENSLNAKEEMEDVLASSIADSKERQKQWEQEEKEKQEREKPPVESVLGDLDSGYREEGGYFPKPEPKPPAEPIESVLDDLAPKTQSATKTVWPQVVGVIVIVIGLMAGVYYLYSKNEPISPQNPASSTITTATPERTIPPVTQTPAVVPVTPVPSPAKPKTLLAPEGDIHIKTNTTFTIEYGNR